MRGRQVFMQSLVLNGADRIFGNPGTTENPLLESLLEFNQVKYITALHESVAVCAAGLYAQSSGRTAVANVHVAPGLGNAIGMMYGCLKSQVPVIVTAGQQDTRMRLREPLLRHDLVAMAAPVVKWAAEPQSADEIGPLMRQAFQIANAHPKGPVFVALPNNVMEQETEVTATSATQSSLTVADSHALDEIAQRIQNAQRIAVCPGDHVASYGATAALERLLTLTGAEVWLDFITARRSVSSRHLQYAGNFSADAAANQKKLAPYDLIIATGGVTLEEIWYEPTSPIPNHSDFVQIEVNEASLGKPHVPSLALTGDLEKTYDAISDRLERCSDAVFLERRFASLARQEESQSARWQVTQERTEALEGRSPLAPIEALQVLAGALPQDIVIVDEAITASSDVDTAFEITDPNRFFGSRGGGIGQGIAGALGVAEAKPDEMIIAISGDGSAMYSIQSLWTAVHHDMRILFVILANAEYRVLKHNLDIHRARFDAPSDQNYPHMDLGNPTLGFAAMAQGMGVQACQATTTEEIQIGCKTFTNGSGPYLLEIKVAGMSD